MVYRVYVEKKEAFAQEAANLLSELRNVLRIGSLTGLRILNRYDAEGLTKELFDYAVQTVFSEPQVDRVSDTLSAEGATVFGVEYLPGQFDQRADSAAQCIQIISREERPLIKTARIYLLYGAVSEAELAAIKKHVINPVEAREASLAAAETLTDNGKNDQ